LYLLSAYNTANREIGEIKTSLVSLEKDVDQNVNKYDATDKDTVGLKNDINQLRAEFKGELEIIKIKIELILNSKK